jgi:hypothetical protein
VALERQQHPRKPVGQLEPDQAAADADAGEVSLVAEPLNELEATAQQTLQVDFYDRPLLTEIARLCDPLAVG